MVEKRGSDMAKINIVGTGTIGEATGVALRILGHDVVAYDVQNKDTFLGKTKHVNTLRLRDTDITMICTPTPNIDGEICLDNLIDVTGHIGDALRDVDEYHLVVVRCTVPPYTTEEIVIPLLRRNSGRKEGDDFGVCMQPEFLRQRRAIADALNPWIIVIGAYDKKSHDFLYNLLSKFSCPIVSTDLKTAEMAKYVHNHFNSTKISFFNAIYMMCESLGIDSEIVSKIVANSAEGSWNKEYGIHGGYPYGGACLPKDIQAFIAYCHQKGLDPSLLEAVEAVNEKIRTFKSDNSKKGGFTTQ